MSISPVLDILKLACRNRLHTSISALDSVPKYSQNEKSFSYKISWK